MRALFKENLIEALIGALVLAVGIWFVVWAYDRTAGGGPTGGYTLSARFPNASGVSVGTDVRISGLKVGTVEYAALDPETFQALLRLDIDRDARVPVDSSAAITSEGILGGNYIALIPGAETAMLKDGGEIVETQGSVDLMGLIGQVVNGSGERPAPAPAEASPTP